MEYEEGMPGHEWLRVITESAEFLAWVVIPAVAGAHFTNDSLSESSRMAKMYGTSEWRALAQRDRRIVKAVSVTAGLAGAVGWLALTR